MTRFPNLAREFPSFDESTLPDIPPGWLDMSWHNDACPSFSPADWQEGQPFIQVYIDWPDPADRECGPQRFSTVEADAQCTHETGVCSDDWAEILAAVAAFQAKHGPG